LHQRDHDGAVVSEVISHAAATSFIHMQTFDVSHVNHSMRYTGRASGAHAESGFVRLS
jgi:hypothetical protein